MIPVNEPMLTEREAEAVVECVRSGWISSAGHFIDAFEQRWAEYCGRRYGVAVCNGTAALEVAVAALGIQSGDEVILPTFTIISCALAVVRAGGTVVLVDSSPRTWTMDVDAVARRITPRTKAVMAVHIYGHPADMDPILALADRHGLAVIEDAAEAHGAEYRSQAPAPGTWRRCGTFGAVSCFSFYANKLITTGEGGMVVTDDPALAERARSLRNLCFQPSRRFYHEAAGYNLRMTNLQAALGVAQLERIDAIIAKKRWIGREYTARLRDLRGLEVQVEEPWARSVYWMYGIVVREETGMTAADVARALEQRGVETRPFFLGMHAQPVFRQRGWFLGEAFPEADRLARQGLYLPSGLALTPKQLDEVVGAVRAVLGS